MLTLGCREENAHLVTALASERFAESVFMTEYNEPVCLYALQRAKVFAAIRRETLVWIQADDSTPTLFFGDYTNEALMKKKKEWW